MQTQQEPIYGINTGFGSLCNVKISNEHLSKLQENLMKSHACGTGEEVPHDIVIRTLKAFFQGDRLKCARFARCRQTYQTHLIHKLKFSRTII